MFDLDRDLNLGFWVEFTVFYDQVVCILVIAVGIVGQIKDGLADEVCRLAILDQMESQSALFTLELIG